MKKIIKTMSCLVLCASMVTTCFAATGEISYNGGEAEVVFTGKASEERAGQIVTVKIVDKDADGDAAVDSLADIVFTRQTTTDEEGKYILNADFSATGDLEATVAVDGETATTTPIYKSTVSEVSTTIGKLNGGTTVATIVSDSISNPVAETDRKVLGVDRVEFTTNNASGLLSAVLDAEKPFSTTTLADFKGAYNKGLFFVSIEGGASAAEILGKMEALGEELAAATPKKKAQLLFEGYSEAEKLSVIEKLRSKRISTNTGFYNALYDAVVIKELNETTNDDEKFAIMEENSDYLDGVLTRTVATYKALPQFEGFKSALFAGTINSVATLKTQCEALYPTYSETTDDDGDDDGGGGGSVGFEPKPPISVGSGLFPKPDASGEGYFNDLAGYEWAVEAIHNLADKKVINGKGDKLFAPADNVTRAEFVKILIGALGISAEDKGINFSDIPKSHWAYEFVKIAASAGIVNGVSDGVYGADALISREDMAVMCYRALEYAEGDLTTNKTVTFEDAGAISEYAETAVDALSGMGIINGKGNGVFDPKNVATRAEAAKVIYSLLGRI